MARLAGELVVHPLFYDALSGEFMPPTDRRGHPHTMGRLACATFMQGTELEHEDEPETIFSYSPSWGAGATVEAECRVSPDELFTLNGVTLYGPEEQRLGFYELLLARSPRHELQIVRNGEEQASLQLEWGERLDPNQAMVAQAAQEFFDNLRV